MPIPFSFNRLGIQYTYTPTPTPQGNPLCFTATEDNSTIKLSKTGSPSTDGLKYWNNITNNWQPYSIDTILSANTGQKIYFKNTNNTLSLDLSNYCQFVMTGKFNASGNTMSLMNNRNDCTQFCFYNLFKNCSSLITPPELPATTLALNCYDCMFLNCYSLIKTPTLSATNLADWCYATMFANCSSIITITELPAQNLTFNCYRAMFENCTSLSTAPTLSSTHLANNCYYAMFNGCSSLSTAPTLPASTLTNECYLAMFNNCNSLTMAPELPATSLADCCYQMMFMNCSSLTTAPALPASELQLGCYSYMFKNCSSLSSMPDLPANEMKTSCYYHMFENCTSLTSAALSATVLVGFAFECMFYGCSSLSSINVKFTTWDYDSNFYLWVNNVAAYGTFTKPYSLPTEFGTNRIPVGWTVIDKDQPLPTTELCFTAAENNSTIKLTKTGSPSINGLKYFDKNHETWQPYTIDTILTANGGQKIYFKNNNNTLSNSESNYCQFVMTGKFNASGNIMSLLKNRNDCTIYCFYKLFSGCSGLLIAPTLPSRILANSCYYLMFENCTSLTTAPALPASDMATNCYYYMFSKCSSLVNPPVLSAMVLATACYRYMFNQCTSLTTAPALPANTLITDCYANMFRKCYALSSCTLPATSLASYCYGVMFEKCTSLITPPELPATSLASNCYDMMFFDCKALSAAPALPATSLAAFCYSGMFWNCSSLTTAPALPATSLANDCYGYMFNGCTSLTGASELPASDLQPACYYRMFAGCSSLTDAPLINAYQFADNSCNHMFSGCSNLSSMNINFLYWPSAKTVGWVQNVAASGTFTKLSGLPEEYGNDRIPVGWTVKNKYATPHDLTANDSNPNFVVSQSSDLDAQRLAFRAMDGSIDEQHGSTHTLSSEDNWWKMQWNSPIIVKELIFTNRSGSNPQNGIHLKLQALSNESWIDLLSFTRSTVASKAQFFNVNNNNAYSSYRIYSEDNDYLNIGELEFKYFIPTTPTVSGLCFTAAEDNSTIALSGIGSPTTDGLQYLKNNNWQPYTINTILSANTGQKIYFKNTNNTLSLNSSNYCQFVMTGKFNTSGNIMALLNNREDCTIYCFLILFKDCLGLLSAPELPATTLAYGCYNGMFRNCTSLTVAPELPATTLADGCYCAMFRNCTSLTVAPALPATTLANDCYYSMFEGCSYLSAAPELQANEVKRSCYYSMFAGCSSLTVAPSLPATTLAALCYCGMFENCTSLVNAPELPATILNQHCYQNMFSGTSLTTAPALPVATLSTYCYAGMFSGTSLTIAPALPATTLATYCYYGMFKNCTSLTVAPELQASTLIDGCYGQMFRNCTSLTVAPELPATSLSNHCYGYMFNGCTSLNSIKVKLTSWYGDGTQNWVQNVATSGTFTKPTVLNESFNIHSIPSGWTVINQD